MSPWQVAAGLAAFGAACVAAGIGWICPPAGVIAAGIESIAGAYLVAYFGRPR